MAKMDANGNLNSVQLWPLRVDQVDSRADNNSRYGGRRMRFKNARTIGLLVAVAIAIIVGGCTNKYILVKKASHRVSAPENKAEVVATARYKEMASNITVIAYRPPDLCLNQAASQATGLASSDQEVLKTTCGVWISELERAFAEKGFKVISWGSLLGASNDGDALLEKARRMGVQVLLMVNSLDVGSVDPTKQVNSTIEFIESNRELAELGPRPVDNRIKRSLLSHIPKDAALPNTQWAATLDITAIDLETNQSIWFFRQTFASALQSSYEWSKLFYCDDGRCRASEYNYRKSGSKKNSSKVSKIEVESTDVGRDADPEQTVKFALLKSVVRSLVSEFAAGGAAEPTE